MVADPATQLLTGPRGRRLCAALVHGGAGLTWPPRTPAGPDRWAVLAAAVRDRPPLSQDLLWAALTDSVDSARYWQEPDETDAALADPRARDLLHPVAADLVADPATSWWWADADLTDQTVVRWPGVDAVDPHPPRGDPDLARDWSSRALADDAQARGRPADPAAAWSGLWWSAPCTSGLPHTTRTLLGPHRAGSALVVPVPTPVGLHLVEDEMGWPTARSWPVRPGPAARVLEVRDATGWAALVARHPLRVTAARRHDWYRCTGRVGEWVVPDWGAVAGELDGVHLTVAGWLAVAGRAVEVPGTGAASVLAGWDPDATWWLTDVLRAGAPGDWVRTDDDPPGRWQPTRPVG